ncbi:alpha/beta hydrolase [Pigmentibacter sp. JX0631]|uniref:alpha/beta fold hydrolase n=1 Tax=Pigmentibacter sp. JX0631 TaxID=2976982 RepID=UPI002468C665|nr:alpha/beta hydrolase [Pigmentibacter sp. JX0631]WGL61533.1 alpha/beta hydrolase [Pigmentibacter sp. JX0631]
MDFSTLSKELSELQNPVHLQEGIQFLEYEGAKLAFDYQPAKEEVKSILVLVNGYQRTRLDFRALRKKLEKSLPNTATVALDNRFCGQTIVQPSHSSSLTVSQMAADVAVLAYFFCQKLGLKGFSALGISMGGMIVQTLAASNSEVQNLLLISTTAGGNGRTWPEHMDPSKGLTYINHYENIESTKKHMLKYFGSKFLTTSPLLFEMMCKTMVKAKAEESLEHSRDAEIQFYSSSNFDGVVQLSNIKSKTLVVSGDEDKIIPLENSTFLSNNISNAELITYSEVGHLILIEEPEKFAQDISLFLQ